MRQTLVKIVFFIDILNTILFMGGFMANTFYNTVREISWLDIYTLDSFMGVMYWAIIAMLVITGAVLSVFILVTNKMTNQERTGLVVSLVGYGALVLFVFFLIVPATLMLLAAIFIRVTLLDKG
ncbi:phosphoglycerol transferase MdoB-like AlkP superfamily enzyme [Weissella uvarum]|uniref:hypothetical protein n=1 Tax=Weissella uvarum TaxID=1479233 RepID=UPI0019619BA2|nr:hypothetical protein [Weissella uvarum]MBM7616903.1 phosphoglycerol transferase MdoB-like AlkP superfamily enzyme [Weissella uvarum]MCM0594645.1 hypothetical protein [Weissella uvarum]